MGDIFDHASDVEQMTLQRNLADHHARAAAARKTTPTGMCQNVACRDEFPPGDPRLFCDSRCAAEQHRRTKN